MRVPTRRDRRWCRLVASTAVIVAVAPMTTPAHAGQPATDSGVDTSEALGARGGWLSSRLREVVDAQDYRQIVDLTPPSLVPAVARVRDTEKYGQSAAELASLKRDPVTWAASDSTPGAALIHQMPNLDVAVIELDPVGRPRTAADVLVSPRYPHGISVPLDRDLSTDQVRWRWWDDVEWDLNGGQGTRDVVAGREGAPIDFTSPYPASVLKLMVGFGVLRLADHGRLALDDLYAYQPNPVRPACGEATTKPIRQLFDEMITVSKNESTCALIKMIHDLQAMDQLNQTFVDLGLETLRLTGTSPQNGGYWLGANMSAIDTAKLLLLINSGPGPLWRTASGHPVTRDVLSDDARAFFLRTLADQGHNEMLSTTNWCGRHYPAPGIPQLTPGRWVDPQTGTMTVGDAVYGQDVRPCDAVAEVTFAHKTGWVDTTGSDAGIVHSLPGKPRRDYIVVVFSNVGTDYVDVNRPADPPGTYPVLYTEKHAKLGRAIDCLLRWL